MFAFIGVENAFSPFRSEVEARVAHSDALRRDGCEEPEWSLRNGGCVAGLPCEDENEGRGKIRESSRLEGSEAEAYIAVSHVTVDNFVYWLKVSNLLLSVLTRSLKELIGLGVRDCGLGERIYYGDCFDGKD